MNSTTIGLDIAKDTFHAVSCNIAGKMVKKKLSRSKVLPYFANRPACIVAIEARDSAHYWAREIEKLGHLVKLIPSQHVKAFLIGNKNDFNDALAIAVASRQPHIKEVCPNTIEQQDSQALHKARKLAVRQRTALCNQIRGLAAEYGISINQGVSTIRKHLAIWQSEQWTKLSTLFKHLLFQLTEQLNMLDVSIDVFESMIKT
ncbi:MAG: IS110 family transposase [Glaciecola sp.]|jgi:transposase